MRRPNHLWVVGDAAAPEEIVDVGESNVPRRWLGLSPRWRKALLSLGLVCLFVLSGVAYGLHSSSLSPSANETSTTTKAFSGTTGQVPASDSAFGQEQGNEIRVDVHGDVRHPGVVTVAPNARVQDAIQAAGGLLHSVDARSINSAALVWDGEEVDVAGAGNVNTGDPVPTSASSATKSGRGAGSTGQNTGNAMSKVNLNSADEATLETLPGVGPKRAQEILAYRQTHGAFSSVDELLQIKGVGPTTLAKWKPDLYVEGAGNSAAS